MVQILRATTFFRNNRNTYLFMKLVILIPKHIHNDFIQSDK